MIFYYHTIFSFIPIGLIYLLGTAALAVLWYLLRRWKVVGWALVIPLWLGLLVAPWLEELWIAYHFGQACKDSGLVITKQVQVEGFYDDTHGWTERKLRESRYRFVEGKTRDGSGGNVYWRHEWINGAIKTYNIDRPSARYHFQQPFNHAKIGHKITKIERVVIDVDTGEAIARERIYGRDAPWYFLGLDRPLMQCPPYGLQPALSGKLLYEAVLEPRPNP